MECVRAAYVRGAQYVEYERRHCFGSQFREYLDVVFPDSVYPFVRGGIYRREGDGAVEGDETGVRSAPGEGKSAEGRRKRTAGF